MYEQNDPIQQDFDRWLHGDGAAAEAAFERVWARIRPNAVVFIRRNYKNSPRIQDRAEDIVQDVYLKVKALHKKVPSKTLLDWTWYVLKAANNRAIDFVRREGKEAPTSDENRESAEAFDSSAWRPETVIDELFRAEQLREMRRLANVVLLGLDPDCDHRIHNVQLVAAQMYYLEHAPVAKIARALAPGMPDGKPIDLRTLDSWLVNPAVLRFLAYQELYYNGDQLAGHILCSDRYVTPETLDSRTKVPPGDGEEPGAHGEQGLDPREAFVINWRYRYGKNAAWIASHADCPYANEAEVETVCDRFHALFPFKCIREQLVSLLAGIVLVSPKSPREEYSTMVGKVLHQKELWQRLAFQYRYYDELTDDDLLSRLPGPAPGELPPGEKPYEVKRSTLNGWLSQHRLLDRIREALVNAGGVGP